MSEEENLGVIVADDEKHHTETNEQTEFAMRNSLEGTSENDVEKAHKQRESKEDALRITG